MALAPPEQQRLARLLGMLGSAHDGEVLNAARLAQRLLATANMTWTELVATPPALTPAEIDLARIAQLEADAFERGRRAGLAEQTQGFTSWPLLADHCLHQCGRLLTPWETGFLADFIARRWTVPTAKQHPIFARIAARCGVPLPADRPGTMWGTP
jgi:hypothetical protein